MTLLCDVSIEKGRLNIEEKGGRNRWTEMVRPVSAIFACARRLGVDGLLEARDSLLVDRAVVADHDAQPHVAQLDARLGDSGLDPLDAVAEDAATQESEHRLALRRHVRRVSRKAAWPLLCWPGVRILLRRTLPVPSACCRAVWRSVAS